MRSVTVQLMAALLIMVSLALIFAEATIITDGKPDLSVFSLLIKSAGDNESLVQVSPNQRLFFLFDSWQSLRREV